MKHFSVLVLTMLFLASCGSTSSFYEELPLYLEAASPEENSLNLVKITDEASGSVVAPIDTKNYYTSNLGVKLSGYSPDKLFQWNAGCNLSVSPDGTQIAYLSQTDKTRNIIVRSTGATGVSTQRTFRDLYDGIFWGPDNNLYFADKNAGQQFVCSVNATQGSIMKQLTNGNVDDNFPAVSSDCSLLFFTRWQSSYGPSIWSLNLKDGTLSLCARGYSPCLIPGNNDAFYCVRNTTEGRSEIWLVDFINGQESLLLSDANHSFTDPALSPDGNWLLLVGNSVSTISKKQNRDIFVVRTDGTQLTQLTYHPEADLSPVWGKDGKTIFFISSRANKDQKFNIWRMNFSL